MVVTIISFLFYLALFLLSNLSEFILIHPPLLHKTVLKVYSTIIESERATALVGYN